MSINNNIDIINYTKAMYNELRTSLSITYMNIDLLNEKYKEDKEGKGIINVIESSIHYIDNILEKINLFNTNKIEISNFKPFNIRKLVDNTKYICSYLLKDNANNCKVEYTISKKIFNWFYGDFYSLKHVLIILIKNAIQYSSKNNNNIIKLLIYSDEKTLQNNTDLLINNKNMKQGLIIRIMDNNEHIDLSTKEMLFQKYVDTKNIKLGLFMAKNIIELYKGSIEHSFIENRGNNFTIKLHLTKCDDVSLHKLNDSIHRNSARLMNTKEDSMLLNIDSYKSSSNILHASNLLNKNSIIGSIINIINRGDFIKNNIKSPSSIKISQTNENFPLRLGLSAKNSQVIKNILDSGGSGERLSFKSDAFESETSGLIKASLLFTVQSGPETPIGGAVPYPNQENQKIIKSCQQDQICYVLLVKKVLELKIIIIKIY
jgi:hypothetical protein